MRKIFGMNAISEEKLPLRAASRNSTTPSGARNCRHYSLRPMLIAFEIVLKWLSLLARGGSSPGRLARAFWHGGTKWNESCESVSGSAGTYCVGGFGLRNEFRARSISCSSGLRPSMNFGSFSAACCVEALMRLSIAR
jgi:hypothetical protein